MGLEIRSIWLRVSGVHVLTDFRRIGLVHRLIRTDGITSAGRAGTRRVEPFTAGETLGQPIFHL